MKIYRVSVLVSERVVCRDATHLKIYINKNAFVQDFELKRTYTKIKVLDQGNNQ